MAKSTLRAALRLAPLSKLYASALLLAAGLLFTSAGAEAAANHCGKGQPCGNSCISREMVCRIGVGEKFAGYDPAEDPGAELPYTPAPVASDDLAAKAPAAPATPVEEPDFSADLGSLESLPAREANPRTVAPPIPVPEPLVLSRHLRAEEDYQHELCAKWSGVEDYRLSDGTTVDCVTMKYAVEFAYAEKWPEALGKALDQGRRTGLVPTVALIIESSRDLKQLDALTRTKRHYRLPLRLEKVMMTEVRSAITLPKAGR